MAGFGIFALGGDFRAIDPTDHFYTLFSANNFLKYVGLKNKTTLVVITKAKGTEHRREFFFYPYTEIKSYMGGHQNGNRIPG